MAKEGGAAGGGCVRDVSVAEVEGCVSGRAGCWRERALGWEEVAGCEARMLSSDGEW